MGREDEDEAPSRRPSDRNIWTSGWVGTPGLIAVALGVVSIFNFAQHRWTAAIFNGALALVLLPGAVVMGRRAQSR